MNHTSRIIALASASLIALAAPAAAFTIDGNAGAKLQAKEVATFKEPWAMTFLPDGAMLVTEKRGKLFHVTEGGKKTEVRGMPSVAYGGQGGLGDVVLHPDFTSNGLIYISYAERDASGKYGAVVVRGRLVTKGAIKVVENMERIWEQVPKLSGRGHYSHKMAFAPDGHLFITSGDRQRQTPAQNFTGNLGKVLRLKDDGSLPKDNPWQDKGEIAKQFWSIGHRNLLGITFTQNGALWTNEMGPKHGDELNLIERGSNYGWPVVSDGDNYNGSAIPDHNTRPEFNAPEASWVPSIAPSGLVIYSGSMFSDWQGDAFIGGLRSRALIRVDINGKTAKEAERFEWGARVREVEQGPNGALWVLEDGDGGKLLKLTQ